MRSATNMPNRVGLRRLPSGSPRSRGVENVNSLMCSNVGVTQWGHGGGLEVE